MTRADSDPETDTEETEEQTIKAIDALREQLVLHREKLPKILNRLVENARNQGKPIDALNLLRILKECTQVVIDCAYKIAPYESAKLESIAIKSDVEHRFVMELPKPMRIEEWLAHTGASRAPIPHLSNEETTDEESDYREPGEPPTIN